MTHRLARRLSYTAAPSYLFSTTTSISTSLLNSLKSSYSTESSEEGQGAKTTPKPQRDPTPLERPPSKSSRALEDDDIFDFTSGFDVDGDKRASRARAKAVHGNQRKDAQSQFPDLLSAEAAMPPPDKLTSRLIDGCFFISNKVYELWKRVWNQSEVDILRSANSKKETPPNADDYRVLAEVIEMYLSVVRTPGPHRLSHPVDTQALENLAAAIHMQYGSLLDESKSQNGETSAAMLREAVGSPLKSRVVNMAPPGRLPWEVLGVDESRGVIHWGVDLTSGKVSDPWNNARLSEAAKQTMFKLHIKDPERYSVQALAKVYRIREQRVMAILALKELEERSSLKGVDAGGADAPKAEAEAEELRRLMDEGFWNCSEPRGSGERHVVTVPSYPSYRSVPVSTLKSLKEEASTNADENENGKEGTTLQESVRSLLGMKSDEEIANDWAEREERRLVEEFKTNLDINMGRVGASLHKGSRGRLVPSRPEKGKRFGLLVTPLGSSSGSSSTPYVAEAADGSVRRGLNDDERLLLSRRRRYSRRSINT